MSDQFHCLCCGRDLPAKYNFRPGRAGCRTCETMTPDEIILTTRATAERDLKIDLATGRAKRTTKRASLMEKYRTEGKRCGCCHNYKPASAFDACAPRVDGLQPQCRACNKLRVSMMEAGCSTPQWHATRDALRAAAHPEFDPLADPAEQGEQK